MNELETLKSNLDTTAETLGIKEETEIEPPRDPVLEQYLNVFDALAEKYEDPDKPLESYNLNPEDEKSFSSAYHGLNGELVQRASKYRRAEIESPLYPSNVIGRVYKLVDDVFNQRQFRENERTRMLDEGEIPNPYKTAREYIRTILLPQLQDKTVVPELLRIATLTVRKFDRTAIENQDNKK